MENGNISGDVEHLRLALRKGLYKPFEGLAFRCIAFYADVALARCQLQSKQVIEGLSEVFKSSAFMLLSYQTASESFAIRDDDEANRGFRMLLIFGLIQCITQVVESTEHICKELNIVNENMKKRDYWAFRNKVNHVLLDVKRSSTRGLDKRLPLNEFVLAAGSFDAISYRSTGTAGYSIRHAKMSTVVNELHMDLIPLMDAILAEIRA